MKRALTNSGTHWAAPSQMAFGMQTRARGMHHLPSGGFVWKSNTPLKLYFWLR